MAHDNHEDREERAEAHIERPPDRQVTDLEKAAEISVTPDVLFGVLADARQRRILYLLIENGRGGTLEEIGEQLAAWENESTVELTTAELTNRITAGMYHADVPKLEEYGFVEYDRESGQITATLQTEEIVPMLELAEQLERQGFETFLEDIQRTRPQDTDRETE